MIDTHSESLLWTLELEALENGGKMDGSKLHLYSKLLDDVKDQRKTELELMRMEAEKQKQEQNQELELLRIEAEKQSQEQRLEAEKQKTILDTVKWAVGGLGIGLVAWATMYYEENSIVTGSRGRLLGKVVDKAIGRR